jgi:hypothetical protein
VAEEEFVFNYTITFMSSLEQKFYSSVMRYRVCSIETIYEGAKLELIELVFVFQGNMPLNYEQGSYSDTFALSLLNNDQENKWR